MKTITIGALLVAAVLFAGLQPGETQIAGKTWLRFGHTISDGNTLESGFEVARGYFVWSHQFTSNIGTKFNVDLYSSDKDSDANGAGLKLKAAYVEFGGIVPDAKIKVGLIKHYFGTVYDYDYRIIQKDPADKYGYAASADYGIALDGHIPSGWGNYQLAIYNGEGYKHPPGENDNNYEFLGNIRFIPLSGITIGGTVDFTKNDDPASTDPADPDKLSDLKIATVFRGVFGPVDLRAQYLMFNQEIGSDFDNIKGSVISIMPSVSFLENFEVIARYDINDPNSDTDDDETTLIGGGINYALSQDSKGKANVRLQTQFEQMSSEGSEDVNQISVQLQYMFKSNPF